MAKFTKGLGARWQAHHILEVKIAKNVLGLEAAERLPAVILSEAEHKALTARLATKTKIGMSPAEAWAAYQEVYAKYPTWLAAIQRYFVTPK